MQPLEFNADNTVKLSLTIHNITEKTIYDEGLLYAICLNCGKENQECSIKIQ